MTEENRENERGGGLEFKKGNCEEKAEVGNCITINSHSHSLSEPSSFQV